MYVRASAISHHVMRHYNKYNNVVVRSNVMMTKLESLKPENGIAHIVTDAIRIWQNVHHRWSSWWWPSAAKLNRAAFTTFTANAGFNITLEELHSAHITPTSLGYS